MAAVLRQALPDCSVGLFGDRVHVVTETAEATRARIEELLRQAGLQLASIRPVEPGLEDVFISVLGQPAQVAA